MDKCQRVRNPGSRSAYLVRLLSKERLLFVSATLFLNTLTDVEGILKIISYHADLEFPVPNADTSVEQFFHDDTIPDTEIIGHGRLYSNDNVAAHNGLGQIKTLWNNGNKRRLRQLNPGLLFDMAHIHSWGPVFVATALKSTLSLIQLRRSMYNPMILPGARSITRVPISLTTGSSSCLLLWL